MFSDTPEIRQTIFGWTTQKFPFSVKTAHALKIREPHVITVTGKAFYDIGHAPADHSNRRSTPKGYAVWEIHPVMKMEVIPSNTGRSSLIGYMQRAGLYGIAEHFTQHGFLFCVDAHRDGKRFIAKADDLLTAFLSLERDVTELKGANGNATRQNVG